MTNFGQSLNLRNDWIQKKYPAWNQSMVRSAHGLEKPNQFDGYWASNVKKAGEYIISMSRWPIDSELKIRQSIPAQPVVPGVQKNYSATDGQAIPITKAVLKINGKVLEEKDVTENDTVITFKVKLEKGSMKLSPYFIFENNNKKGEVGAYFCRVHPAE